MGIIDIFYPRTCVGCKRAGQYICAECRRKLGKPEQICPMCCRPSLDGWTHPRCKQGAVMERLMVGLTYRGLVQQCLKNVKYKSSWEVVDFLFNLCNFEKIEGIVVPIPMYAPKERARGFNQADRIARHLGEPLQLLERVRGTKPMFGLKKKERRENISGAFKLIDQCQSDTVSRVILIDDVWTTGATMRECAKMLKRAGVKQVWGVALAR